VGILGDKMKREKREREKKEKGFQSRPFIIYLF